MSTPDIEHLRQLIQDTLSELGMPNAAWSCVKGKCFELGQLHPRLPRSEVLAVWLADRNQVEFRSENGSLLKTVSLNEHDAVACVGAA